MTDQENNAKRLPLRIGYCTNVHAGRDLPAVLDNLLHFSLPIRQLVSPESSMGVGLWFSEVSAQQAIVPANLHLLRSQPAGGGIVIQTQPRAVCKLNCGARR